MRVQDPTSNTYAGRAVDDEPPVETAPRHFNIPWGSGGFDFTAGLGFQYVDNVFLTYTDPRDDFVLIPQCDITAFFPTGPSDTLDLEIGIAYYNYFKNTQLNSSTPLISPNSQLAFTLLTGDFKFIFSERFSYQESPVYQNGGQYYNIYNSGEFRRYLNLAGVAMTWDLNQLVITAGFHNEALFSNGSTYSYIDHVSELFNLGAMFNLTPTLSAGLESAGSLNRFKNSPDYDTWRARVGPGFRWNLSQFINVRLGAGYERIQYDSSSASALGLTYEDTYYAYGRIDHKINRFFTHSLQAWHDNQLGFNAANLEGTHISYSMAWRPNPELTLSAFAAFNWYTESFGSSSANLYNETYTFFSPEIQASYQFDQHWQASLRWDYRLKNSDIKLDGYAQNLVSIEILYRF